MELARSGPLMSRTSTLHRECPFRMFLYFPETRSCSSLPSEPLARHILRHEHLDAKQAARTKHIRVNLMHPFVSVSTCEGLLQWQPTWPLVDLFLSQNSPLRIPHPNIQPLATDCRTLPLCFVPRAFILVRCPRTPPRSVSTRGIILPETSSKAW